MCDSQWDPLAELFLTKSAWHHSIICLCSRSFSSTKDDRNRIFINAGEECSASETEFAREDYLTDLPTDCIDTSHHLVIDNKQEADTEVVSCYCSASHTDNISTDEHDSLRDSHPPRALGHRGLQSSDSGADLSEHLRHDPDAAWHKFWADHGERLIWDSWIAKYCDYINPGFLAGGEGAENASKNNELENKEAELGFKTTKFSFDRKDLDNLASIDENKELRNLEISLRNRPFPRNLSESGSLDKLNADISEGWNPLSPLSVECETEAERLLSSRCGSYASGSIRTVDSMTNVTRMTVSSVDFSESSKSSDSFSSVSSVKSSLSSTSSEDYDNENGDYDLQWNHLWKKHYEEEYLRQYKKFMSVQLECNDGAETADAKKLLTVNQQHVMLSLKKVFKERKNSNNSSFEDDSSKKKLSKKSMDSVSSIIQNFKIDDPLDNPSKEKSTTELLSRSKSPFLENNEEEQEFMKSLGLPVSFYKGSTSSKKAKQTKSYSLDSSAPQSQSDRITAAFDLIGIVLNDKSEEKYKGQVDYKMKHIRLQNRHLKLHQIRDQPKHTRFDDDCNEIPEGESSNYDITSKLSSSSSEDDDYSVTNLEYNFDPSEAGSSMNQRKRKRKLALPAEIKENPRLRKYWEKRFSLFNKFDLGIKLDDESWYSVTPEVVAKHIAQRCKCDIIVDAFCGAGGNTIQFAKTCGHVIAIDIDPNKIEMAKNNAEIYGVSDKIDFIVGDFFHLASTLKANVVFLSPPWGGPSYMRNKVYDLEQMLQPAPLSKLLHTSRKITDNISLFLPKNSNTSELLESAGVGHSVEFEQNFLNKKQISLSVYYNDLINKV